MYYDHALAMFTDLLLDGQVAPADPIAVGIMLDYSTDQYREWVDAFIAMAASTAAYNQCVVTALPDADLDTSGRLIETGASMHFSVSGTYVAVVRYMCMIEVWLTGYKQAEEAKIKSRDTGKNSIWDAPSGRHRTNAAD